MSSVEMMTGAVDAAFDPFAGARALADDVRELAARHGLEGPGVVAELVGILGALITEPKSTFPTPPEYRRADLTAPALAATRPVTSSHGFFDVLRARASRRDFGSAPLDARRLSGLLHWTLGARSETMAYDYRGAPLRYVPSAGGLASIDAYAIAGRVTDLDPGSYYFDYATGLVPVSRGAMMHRIAGMNPGQEWISHAGAVIVLVANTERVGRKYGAMGAKLTMMDAGVVAGHLELVATALELRSCTVGGLPPERMAALLRLDDPTRIPVAAVVVGTREEHSHS